MNLLAVSLTQEQIAIVALATLLTAFVVGFFLRKDTAVEQRRLAVNKVVSMLRAEGLGDIAEVLEQYVVGDYQGIVQSLHQLVHLCSDPVKFDAMLLQHFKGQFPTRLADAETGPWICDQVAAFEAAQDAQVQAAQATAKQPDQTAPKQATA